jgi:hypothetical protein
LIYKNVYLVRQQQDILDLRKIIQEGGKQTKICAKIEKPEGIFIFIYFLFLFGLILFFSNQLFVT